MNRYGASYRDLNLRATPNSTLVARAAPLKRQAQRAVDRSRRESHGAPNYIGAAQASPFAATTPSPALHQFRSSVGKTRYALPQGCRVFSFICGAVAIPENPGGFTPAVVAAWRAEGRSLAAISTAFARHQSWSIAL